MTELEIEIVRVYADNNMKLRPSAKQLFYTDNSLRYQFKRIKRKTGLDPQNFYDLAKLLGV